jgi:oxygen-independent coproporphyrinogen-3 oxidase
MLSRSGLECDAKLGRKQILQPASFHKYSDARLPRYTSYPAAPLFTAAINENVYADWLSKLAGDTPISLYLHVPFCRSMCWYCGCHTTISAREQPITDYVELLCREIEIVSAQIPSRPQVTSVHFGGGTPTLMTSGEFSGLMQLLRRKFDIADDAELAIEIDPRTLTSEMLDALGKGGINRASLGVQSFDPAVQKSINRIQTVECTAKAVTSLRRVGVKSINFDLIYGLPHQTVRSCIDTVVAALTMRPDRLAVFGYAHVPEFKKHQRLIDQAALPDSALRTRQALAIAETLVAAGYCQIGLDHFALPADQLVRAQPAGRLRRNFQGYAVDDCDTLIGFGASAIGQMREGYVQNEVGLGNYFRRIAAGRLSTARGYSLTAEDRVRAAVIERLMCDLEANIGAICSRHAFDPRRLIEENEKLDRILGEGLADIDDGTLRIPNNYRFLVRAVAAAFDSYLECSPRIHSKAV